MATLFSQIIAGEIPSYKIYEDAYVYAFLDIFPQNPGHTLIVPKIEIDHFSDLPEPYYSAIFQIAKKLSPILQQVTHCQRVCTAYIGYEIPHCHYHLLPTNSMEDMQFSSRVQAKPEDLKNIQTQILTLLNL